MVIRKYSVITYCDKVKKVHYEESLKSIYLSIYTSALPIDDLFTILIDFDHFRSILITSDLKFRLRSRSDLRSQI